MNSFGKHEVLKVAFVIRGLQGDHPKYQGVFMAHMHVNKCNCVVLLCDGMLHIWTPLHGRSTSICEWKSIMHCSASEFEMWKMHSLSVAWRIC